LPLYEYRCRKCGKHTEKIQKFSDRPLATCPHCGGKLEKLISSSAIRFKGTGWYVTDYAKKSAPAESKKDGGGTAKESKTPTMKDSPGTKVSDKKS
jgi:putative FmdB family regulatory protein